MQQLSQKSALLIPSKWEEKFILKRIDENDIELTLNQRNAFIEAMARGDRFVQIGKYTIMVNSIKSIEPKWGEKNIPPRPDEKVDEEIKGNTAILTVKNQEELDEWDRLFGNEGKEVA